MISDSPLRLDPARLASQLPRELHKRTTSLFSSIPGVADVVRCVAKHSRARRVSSGPARLTSSFLSISECPACVAKHLPAVPRVDWLPRINFAALFSTLHCDSQQPHSDHSRLLSSHNDRPGASQVEIRAHSQTVNLTFPSGSVKSASFSGGLFINNQFVAGADGATFEVVNPSTGKKIADVAEAKAADVDRAVAAAEKAYNTTWGLKADGVTRCNLMIKLAEAIEAIAPELAAIESLDNGKPRAIAEGFDVAEAAGCIRYYAGWADKHAGKVQEVNENKIAFIRHEPIGVVGQIIPCVRFSAL